MHDYTYSANTRGANPPEFKVLIAIFQSEIAAALDSDVDEVLVVGHFSGAQLGVSILSGLIPSDGVSVHEPKLSFLSLKQVVPIVSLLPKAYRLRADLQFLLN
jgi:hypothetical protein